MKCLMRQRAVTRMEKRLNEEAKRRVYRGEEVSDSVHSKVLLLVRHMECVS